MKWFFNLFEKKSSKDTKEKKVIEKKFNKLNYNEFMSFYSAIKKAVENKQANLFKAEDALKDAQKNITTAITKHFNSSLSKNKETLSYAMDSNNIFSGMQSVFNGGNSTIISPYVTNWYASQSFIGFTLCAQFAQHWLIQECCSLPGKDAYRNGYKITSNDGVEIDPKFFDAMKNLDEKYNLMDNLREASTKNRIFGQRIVMFKFKFNSINEEREFYKNPFNIDGVVGKLYLGISQVDPYWTAPELDADSAADPSSIRFFKPTYFVINSLRIHYSHVIFLKNGDELPDIYKPTYYYGGVPLVQMIYEKIYNAERAAAEIPLLLMTKRERALLTDASIIEGDAQNILAQLEANNLLKTNYSTSIYDKDSVLQYNETTLTDVPSTVMALYKLISSVAKIPYPKLFMDQVSGMNSAGNYETESWIQVLESIQTEEGFPIVQRHHEILRVAKNPFGIDLLEIPKCNTRVVFNSPKVVTPKEKAEINKLEADTDAVLLDRGVIDPSEVRDRIVAKDESGYNGLNNEIKLSNEIENILNDSDQEI